MLQSNLDCACSSCSPRLFAVVIDAEVLVGI